MPTHRKAAVTAAPATETPAAVAAEATAPAGLSATHEDGVLILRAVRDEQGVPVDAVIEAANERWRKRVVPSLPSVTGRSFRRDVPHLAGDRWALVLEAFTTGREASYTFPHFDDPLAWGEVHATPLGEDRLLIVSRTVVTSEAQREVIRRNEARFRSALDQSPDTIAIFRPLLGVDGLLEDLEALYINRAALNRWYGGANLEDLAGRRLFEVQPAGRRYLRDLYRHVLATGEPFEGLRRYDSPTGLLWAIVRVAVTPEGIIHTSRDVTELVLAREAQARALRVLEEAQQAGRVGSFEWDPATGGIDCSRELLWLAGLDPLQSPTADEVFRRLDPVATTSLGGRILDAGEAGLERAVAISLPNGEERHLLVRGVVVPVDDGPERVLGTVVDITETRRAEALAAASEARFAAVVNAVEESLAIVRPAAGDASLSDLELEWANPAWLRREGFAALPSGLRPLQLRPEFMALRPMVASVLAGGPTYQSEIHLGDGRWLAVTIVSLDGRALVSSRDVTAARAADKAAQARLLAAIENTGEAVSITDAEGRLIYVNPAFEAMTGVSSEVALGVIPEILRSPGPDGTPSDAHAQLWAGTPWRGVRERTRPDGRPLTVSTAVDPVLDASGAITGFVAVTRDVTRERAEAARREQADRLEAVGRLASGIAHDFNNMLAAISGYGQFALDGLPAGSEVHDDVSQVMAAAQRASALTRQLLLFSRRGAQVAEVVDPAAAVAALLPMLRRLIGGHVIVETMTEPGAPSVMVDPGQLDQVLLNLAINARDAMPEGGRLWIRVGRAERDGTAVTRIAVTDTGAGMSEEVQARIFEPFFTTKSPGSGTGLGLATVYGIVQAAGGWIDVRSAPREGTTFTVDLPAHETASSATRVPTESAMPRGHGEAVLVVEDDPAVRAVVERILRRLGYQVQVADGPTAALEAITAGAPVDLLVSDVRMPGMQGGVLAGWVLAERPSARVLLMTGLMADLEPGLADNATVLQKPFTEQRLAEAARAALA